MLYFAYGSNMSRHRFENRVGPVKKVCTHILKDYELVFDCGNGYDIYANIRPCPGSKVYGVIYDIDKRQENMVDRYEALGIMYIKGYFTYKDREVMYYKGISREGGEMVSAEYIAHLLRGYIENNMKTGALQLIDALFKK